MADDDDFQYTISSDEEAVVPSGSKAKKGAGKSKKKKNSSSSAPAQPSSSSSESEDDFAPDFEFDGDGLDASLSLSGGGGGGLSVKAPKRGGGSWDFKTAIELLARNDERGDQPARMKVDDLIKAERKGMLKKEAEEEAKKAAEKKKKDKEEEDDLDEVMDDDDDDDEDLDEEDEVEDDDDDDDDESSSGTSDSDSSSDDGDDDADDDHVKMNFEDDNLRRTTSAGDVEDDNGDNDNDDDDDDDSDSDSDADSSSASSSSEEEVLDSDEELERRKESAFFDIASSPHESAADVQFSQLGLSRPLLRGVASLGFVTPTPIQSSCIPPALAGRDLVASAVTGSGKTAAFLLPVLQLLLHRPRDRSATRALILTPTRELAAQCVSMCAGLSQYTDARLCLIVGGAKNVRAQATELRGRPDIVVATPGRMLDHVTNATGLDLDDVEVLVLDEADRLLDMGFIEEVTQLVKVCPIQRQTMLFSATFGTKVDELIKLSMKKPIRINVGRKEGSGGHRTAVEIAPRLEQEFVRIRSGNAGNREAILLSLLSRTFKTRSIVFFDTKVTAHRMMIIAGLTGLRCAELHGNLTQTQRLEALDAFKNGDVDTLLCTDLAARGLDISSVECVLNYEMPSNVETYIHRVGRTARAGCGGRSCTLISEGRRHMMKEVLKDAEKKNAASSSSSSSSKKVKAVIKSRTVPAAVVLHFAGKIAKLEPHVADIQAAEEVARLDRIADMEVTKATNIITYADEIKARAPRTWFQTEAEKLEAKDKNKDKFAALKKVITKPGEGTHRLSREKTRRQALRKEQEEWMEENRREKEETGQDQKKITTEANQKASARAAKKKETLKRGRGDEGDWVNEDLEANDPNRKKAKRLTAKDTFGSGGLFEEEMVRFGKKGDDKDKKGKAPGSLQNSFRGYDENATKLKKGGKLSNKKFKSKAKHNRRKR